MTHEITTLVADAAFPEGPAFDPDGDLWWVEAEAGALARLSGGELERFDVGGTPNGLAFDESGRCWLCDAGRDEVRLFDPATGDPETVAGAADGEPLDWPNDLAFDARGNLVFTCPGSPEDSPESPTGSVCCLRPDGTVTTVATGLTFPNGLAFVDDGTSLVVAETYAHRLVRGDWNPETATLDGPEAWADVGGPVGPDGMALGADGRLYVAVYGAGAVRVVEPGRGAVESVEVPGANPTNVAFDPADELGLVVTEAERGAVLSLPDLGPGSPTGPYLGRR